MEEKKEEGLGFTVSDRRGSGRRQELEKEMKVAADLSAESKKEGPQADFSSLILSLSTSVLIQLGEIADPISKKKEQDLPLARQTIDLIGIIKEKTTGNLTKQEEDLLNEVLYNLRMRFVSLSKKG